MEVCTVAIEMALTGRKSNNTWIAYVWYDNYYVELQQIFLEERWITLLVPLSPAFIYKSKSSSEYPTSTSKQYIKHLSTQATTSFPHF